MDRQRQMWICRHLNATRRLQGAVMDVLVLVEMLGRSQIPRMRTPTAVHTAAKPHRPSLSAWLSFGWPCPPLRLKTNQLRRFRTRQGKGAHSRRGRTRSLPHVFCSQVDPYVPCPTSATSETFGPNGFLRRQRQPNHLYGSCTIPPPGISPPTWLCSPVGDL